jgi:glycerophosphoryl diester phosphodiesterase
MLVIAHRGASGHCPENTLRAYETAIEMRADMIEIDLHRTKDGAIVITHNSALAGLGGPSAPGVSRARPDSSGKGEIADASLAEVRALDAGDGQRVPTLDEVLDGFAKRIPFNLEVKWGRAGDYEGLEAETLEALRSRRLGRDILFSSFRPSILGRLRELDPRARLALLVSPQDRDYTLDAALAQARELGCEALNPHWTQTDAALVAAAQAAELAVNVYTVNDIQGMRRMLDLGVDGVFTNFPDLLRALLDV